MTNRDYQDKRQNYQQKALDDSLMKQDPFAIFQSWMDEAFEKEVLEPNAMTLATVDAQQQPHARMVLLKAFNKDGFIFYSNYESSKGKELTASNKASLSFYWAELERQIRIEGLVEKLPTEESDAYFQSRPQASQLSAYVSRQSQPVDSKLTLENLLESAQGKFGKNSVPRPANWGGYRLAPLFFEFWQGRPNRLHDRIKFTRSSYDPTAWTGQRLFP